MWKFTFCPCWKFKTRIALSQFKLGAASTHNTQMPSRVETAYGKQNQMRLNPVHEMDAKAWTDASFKFFNSAKFLRRYANA